MSRAENRHHAGRVKNNRKHYNSAHNGIGDAKFVGMTAITPKRCGCWMCSNQRKSFGEPFSDKRRKVAGLEEEDEDQFMDWVNWRINHTMQFGDDYAFARKIDGCVDGRIEIFCDGTKVAECSAGEIQ